MTTATTVRPVPIDPVPASAFRLAANRVRLWQEEGTYSAHQFVKLPGDRRYRIEVDPTATDPDELTPELESE